MKIIDHYVTSFNVDELKLGDVIYAENDGEFVGYYLLVSFDRNAKYAMVRLSHPDRQDKEYHVTTIAESISRLLDDLFNYPSNPNIKIRVMKDAELHIGGL